MAESTSTEGSQDQPKTIIETSDITFIVEDKPVYAVKAVLMMNSPVFRAMFKGDFKEKDCHDILLEGKKYKVFVEFIKLIHMCSNPADEALICQLIPLAHEYEMDNILSVLEDKLLNCSFDLSHLAIAEIYGLKKLHDNKMEEALKKDVDDLSWSRHEAFSELSQTTILLLYKSTLKTKKELLSKYSGIEGIIRQSQF